MKTILNKLENFLKYKKGYEEWCKERCKDWEKGEIYLKLLNEKSIKKRKEIINNLKIQDMPLSYFTCPYLLYLWNGNNSAVDYKNNKSFMLDDDFGEISIDNLYKILKDNNKEHLELKADHSISGLIFPIVILENFNK